MHTVQKLCKNVTKKTQLSLKKGKALVKLYLLYPQETTTIGNKIWETNKQTHRNAGFD